MARQTIHKHDDPKVQREFESLQELYTELQKQTQKLTSSVQQAEKSLNKKIDEKVDFAFTVEQNQKPVNKQLNEAVQSINFEDTEDIQFEVQSRPLYKPKATTTDARRMDVKVNIPVLDDLCEYINRLIGLNRLAISTTQRLVTTDSTTPDTYVPTYGTLRRSIDEEEYDEYWDLQTHTRICPGQTTGGVSGIYALSYGHGDIDETSVQVIHQPAIETNFLLLKQGVYKVKADFYLKDYHTSVQPNIECRLYAVYYTNLGGAGYQPILLDINVPFTYNVIKEEPQTKRYVRLKGECLIAANDPEVDNNHGFVTIGIETRTQDSYGVLNPMTVLPEVNLTAGAAGAPRYNLHSNVEIELVSEEVKVNNYNTPTITGDWT